MHAGCGLLRRRRYHVSVRHARRLDGPLQGFAPTWDVFATKTRRLPRRWPQPGYHFQLAFAVPAIVVGQHRIQYNGVRWNRMRWQFARPSQYNVRRSLRGRSDIPRHVWTHHDHLHRFRRLRTRNRLLTMGRQLSGFGGVVGQLATGLFTLTGTCTWPASGSQEFDLYQYSHANGNQNSSSYRAAGQGAPSMSTFFGTPYFGYIFTNQANVPFAAATLFSPNTTPADPTTGLHTAEIEWEPGLTWIKIDGLQIAKLAAAYISSESKFPISGTRLPRPRAARFRRRSR